MSLRTVAPVHDAGLPRSGLESPHRKHETCEFILYTRVVFSHYLLTHGHMPFHVCLYCLISPNFCCLRHTLDTLVCLRLAFSLKVSLNPRHHVIGRLLHQIFTYLQQCIRADGRHHEPPRLGLAFQYQQAFVTCGRDCHIPIQVRHQVVFLGKCPDREQPDRIIRLFQGRYRNLSAGRCQLLTLRLFLSRSPLRAFLRRLALCTRVLTR
eukprot:IDg11022t1